MLASPGLRLSLRSDPKNNEDGPPPRLLLASASVFLVSCLRVLTRRMAKTGHLRACSWRRFQCSWCLVFAFLPEDERRRATSVLAVGIGFRVLDFLSSRTFGDRTEGGVPNSSPSEPWYDLWEGWGFDSVGAVGVPKRHPSGWAPRWWPAKHSPCSPAKKL